MSQPPHHLLDEALSAHADGALSAAEHAKVRDHLAACLECSERARSLANAAAALRDAPLDPLDAVTRQRLLRRAMAPEPAPARTRWLDPRLRMAGIGALAAAAAVVLAMATFGDDGGRGTETAAGSGGLPIDAANVAVGVGSLDDPETLRSALEANAGDIEVNAGGRGGSALAPQFDASTDAQGGTASGGGSQGGGDAAESGDEDEAATPNAPAVLEPPAGVQRTIAAGDEVSPSEAELSAITRCYRSPEASAFAKENRLIAALTGTYGGKDVVVLGFRLGDGPSLLAMVLRRSDCTLVNTQSFR